MSKTAKRIAGTSSLAVAALLLTAAGTVVAQNKTRITEEDGRTAQMVAELASARHINHPPIDDALSAKLLTRYIEMWDSPKLFFLQSDIDEFNKSKTLLDDQILSGNVEFANTVFDRFRLRLADRKAKIGGQIDADHDFNADETIVRDPKHLAWAKDEAELDDRWRRKIKQELLLLKLDPVEKKEGEPVTDELTEARKRLHKRYHTNWVYLEQTEPYEILETYLTAMTHCMDAHSAYMSPESLEEFRIGMELKLEGIGARLKYEDGYTIVEEVIEGGAAAADGRIIKGDKIIGVSADSVSDFVDVVEMKLTKVVNMIRGARGTKVKLQVLKESGTIEEIVLARSTVQIEDEEVKGKVIESSEWIDGRKARVGILNIPMFYRDFRGAEIGGSDFRSTSTDVKKVLETFRQQNVDVLVVDLRWNGGGALQEAVEVSGLFIPQGPVVQIRKSGNEVEVQKDEDPEMYWRKPMVVVCNRMSASASEIFAGVIRDYKRGIVVGDTTTYGKGTVQDVKEVSSRLPLFAKERGALKLTIAKFYRVNGDSTQTRGVTSDIVLPSLLSHRDVGEDSLENALAFDRITSARYAPFSSLVNDNMISQLGRNSAARVAADREFSLLNKLVQRYVERKNDKTESLNENVLKAEEAELKQEQKEQEEIDKKAGNADAKDDFFPVNYYNRELVSITVDYLELLQAQAQAQVQPRTGK